MMKKLLLYLLLMSGSLCFVLVFTLIFVNSKVISCTRQADNTYNCSLQTFLLGKLPTFKHQIEGVVDAETVNDGCFDGCGYRTEFILADGSNEPLNEVYTDRNPTDLQTAEVKQQLTSGQTSFEYTQEPLWWVLYLVGGLFLMEFVMVTFGMGTSAVREYFANRPKF